MRKVPGLLILAGAVMMWGCHSNSAGNSATAPAPSNSPAPMARDDGGNDADAAPPKVDHSNDKRPVVVCFGDSLTAGLGTGPGQSYPDYLQTDLDQLHYR